MNNNLVTTDDDILYDVDDGDLVFPYSEEEIYHRLERSSITSYIQA